MTKAGRGEPTQRGRACQQPNRNSTDGSVTHGVSMSASQLGTYIHLLKVGCYWGKDGAIGGASESVRPLIEQRGRNTSDTRYIHDPLLQQLNVHPDRRSISFPALHLFDNLPKPSHHKQSLWPVMRTGAALF